MDNLKFNEYLKRMKDIYFYAISAFYTYEGLKEIKASNIVGEDQAKENVKIMNKFKGFFNTTTECTRYCSLIQLSKLFDEARESLHLTSIINYVEGNKKKLGIKHFQEKNKGRYLLNELSKRYKGIGKQDIILLKKMIQNHLVIIGKLKTYRDENLAHEDKKKNEVKITIEEILKLFEVAKEILNILSYSTNFETTTYNHIEKGCKKEIQDIIKKLK